MQIVRCISITPNDGIDLHKLQNRLTKQKSIYLIQIKKQNMKKYRVSRSGKELVERVDDFFIEADKLGAILDDDAIDDDDDSLIGIMNSLVQVGDEGITEEEFDETIGGNWEACLPHLELIE